MSMRYRTTMNNAGLKLVLAFAFFAAACATEAPVAPEADISFAKGGNAPGGSTGISPVKLSDPKTLGCTSAAAYAVSNSSPTVVGGDCSRNGVSTPFLWSGGSATLPVSDAGSIAAVSASGTAYGMRNNLPFFIAPGGPATYLPLPAGMVRGSIHAVADDDNLLFGQVEWDEGVNTYINGAIWSRTESGWTISDSPGRVEDVTPDGGIAVGTRTGRAAYWENIGGTWTLQLLPDDGAITARATGVNETGSVVVGVRWIPLESDPSQTYDEHVAWISDGAGGWNLEILDGLNIREGTATDVSTQVDGSTVAVGRSWDDTSGRGGQLWAVAWRLPAGATHFSAPVRLSPLSRGSTAVANAVNPKGEVVGMAYSRAGSFAVMWRLQ